jgi:hypothetical protein
MYNDIIPKLCLGITGHYKWKATHHECNESNCATMGLHFQIETILS